MKSKLMLLAFLTGAPLISLGVSLRAQSLYQAEWEKAIRLGVKDVNEEALKTFTLERVCSDSRTSVDFGKACTTFNRLQLVSWGAGVALALGLCLPIVISIAGSTASRSRGLLLRLFTSGLYLTNIAVAVLVLVHAALIIAGGWYGMTVLLERISVKLILFMAVIALLSLFGAVEILASLRGIFQKAATAVIGKVVTDEEAPSLWNSIRTLARAAGTTPPSHLVVGLDPNFFVTEADVRCVGGILTGRTMYLSLSLCRILSIQELKAVISHELGHFHGADTEFSLRFYPIYRGAMNSYAAAAAASYDEEGSPTNWAMLPALAILGHFLDAFSSAENKISRERELVADQFAANTVSEEAIASALVKIHAYADNWGELLACMAEPLKQGTIVVRDQTYDARHFFANVSELFASMASSSTSSISLEALEERRIPHPTDSHPPLAIRLESLNRTVKQVAQTALDAEPAEPAISLIDNYETLELELSAIQQYLICPEMAEEQQTAG